MPFSHRMGRVAPVGHALPMGQVAQSLAAVRLVALDHVPVAQNRAALAPSWQ